MAAKSFVRRARRAAAQQELPFWKRKTLAQMTQQEWGIALRRLWHVLRQQARIRGHRRARQTDTCCKLLDPKTARCRDYKNRTKNRPGLHPAHPKGGAKMDWTAQDLWLRLVHFKQDLYWWRPPGLRGPRNRALQRESRPRGRVIPEDQVEDITERVVDCSLDDPLPRPLKKPAFPPSGGIVF